MLLLSAGLVACALAAGLRPGSEWLVELLVVLAVAQGLAAGLALPAFWREGTPPAGGRPRPPWRGHAGTDAADAGTTPAARDAASEDPPPLARILMGAGGRYAVFLASVAFAAVEAHAVGAGLAAGAPGVAATLLLPPILIGALLLRGALARLPGEGGRGRAREKGTGGGRAVKRRGERSRTGGGAG